jgi:hypothetical protein
VGLRVRVDPDSTDFEAYETREGGVPVNRKRIIERRSCRNARDQRGDGKGPCVFGLGDVESPKPGRGGNSGL